MRKREWNAEETKRESKRLIENMSIGNILFSTIRHKDMDKIIEMFGSHRLRR